MKKLFLLLLIFIFPLFLKGQSNQLYRQQEEQQNYYETEVYIDWKLSTPGGWSVPSFYWCITRSKYEINSYYVFDIWFYSNSYVWDYLNQTGIWKSTYIDEIYLFIDGKQLNKNSVWVTFQNKFSYDGLRFYNIDKDPKVYLKWGSAIIP